MWRSSTNILDSVYSDISRSIPTVDAVRFFNALAVRCFIHSICIFRDYSHNLSPLAPFPIEKVMIRRGQLTNAVVFGGMTRIVV